MQATGSPLLSNPQISDLNSQAFAAGGSNEEVAESFESVFASMLVKEVRSTLSEGFSAVNSPTYLAECLTCTWDEQ